MSQSVQDKLIEERDSELERMDTLAASEDFNPDSSEFAAARERVEDLNRSIKARAEFMALKASANELTAVVAKATRRGDSDQPMSRERLSWGEEFTRSEVFTNYPGRGTSSRFLTRALPMTLSTFSTVLDHTKVDNRSPVAPTPLLDLIPAIQVASNSVDLITFNTAAGGSAVVAEGANKPSIEYAPAVSTVTLDTIAGYTQATRQLLEDSQAIRDMIDQELRRDVTAKLESEAAAALVAAVLPTANAATLLESIRVGLGKVQAAGFTPNAVVLNPADWATLDITVLGSTLLGPSVGSQFWGIRPVASNSQPAGTATVGDFSAGTSRFTRTGVNIYVTDSHASTFIANVFTILAEARAKTVVRRTAAFCECTKTP